VGYTEVNKVSRIRVTVWVSVRSNLVLVIGLELGLPDVETVEFYIGLPTCGIPNMLPQPSLKGIT